MLPTPNHALLNSAPWRPTFLPFLAYAAGWSHFFSLDDIANSQNGQERTFDVLWVGQERQCIIFEEKKETILAVWHEIFWQH